LSARLTDSGLFVYGFTCGQATTLIDQCFAHAGPISKDSGAQVFHGSAAVVARRAVK